MKIRPQYHEYRTAIISLCATAIVITSILLSFNFLSKNVHAAQDLQAEPISAEPISAEQFLTSTDTTSKDITAAAIITSTDLLALYALAFDNEPEAELNLSLYYTSTIKGIAAATLNAPDKTAVVLVDRNGSLDTQVLIVQNGQVIPVAGVPVRNPDGGIPILDEVNTEYNMSDGTQLGHFLQWARHTFDANTTTFSFVGHGAPLVPKISLSTDPGTPDCLLDPNSDPECSDFVFTPEYANDSDLVAPEIPGGATHDPILPLPAGFFAHSGFTDFTSSSLISIHALATALKMGTENGADPFQTVDLVQCFASSIEQLYELHPYAETFTGSPNYAYSKPEMIGRALSALSGSMSAKQIADTLIKTYDDELPATEHPRLLVAIDSSKVEAIKESWDMTSYYLSDQLAQDREATREKISRAYVDSAKYDTTLCQDPDFRLESPDSVSDMADFADKISTLFGPTSEVGSWAAKTTQRVNNAVISRYARNGIPWFVIEESVNSQQEGAPTIPEWTFDSPGISLYTDFGSQARDDVVTLDWFSAWYTNTASIKHLNYENPIPYSFLTDSSNNVSWADVFNQYWKTPSGENPTFEGVRCIPAFLSGRGVGEMSVLDFTPTIVSSNTVVALDSSPQFHIFDREASDREASDGEASDGEANSGGARVDFVSFSATIRTSIEAVNPQIRFYVYDRDNNQIFAEAVSPGYLDAGETKSIQSLFRWPLQEPGEYTFEVILDADERFIEENEDDNVVRHRIEIFPQVSIIRIPLVIR